MVVSKNKSIFKFTILFTSILFGYFFKLSFLGNDSIHNVGVQYIIDSVLQALKRDNKRRLVFFITYILLLNIIILF